MPLGHIRATKNDEMDWGYDLTLFMLELIPSFGWFTLSDGRFCRFSDYAKQKAKEMCVYDMYVIPVRHLFLDQRGQIDGRYYKLDGVHLNDKGTRRLAGQIWSYLAQNMGISPGFYAFALAESLGLP